MKIQVISDVHMEFHADGGKDFMRRLPQSDVLVVAGDLCSYRQLPTVLKQLCELFPNVVFIMGNHEAYGTTIQAARESIPKISNLHFLDNGVAEINGQRFLGGTLWFRETPDNFRYESNMSDFSRIQEIQISVYEENARTIQFLTDSVREGDIVVTHHLPTQASVSPEYRTSRLNRFYVCDMDDLIFDMKPKMWIHGHTHHSMDYRHGDTRIVCNPFGYVGYDLNPDFCESKILDV